MPNIIEEPGGQQSNDSTINQKQDSNGEAVRQTETQEDEVTDVGALRETTIQRLGAAFSKNNLGVQLYSAIVDPVTTDKITSFIDFNNSDPNFVLSEAIKDVPEEEKPYYTWCKNITHVAHQENYLAEKKLDDKIIEESGFLEGLASSTIAFITDPTNVPNTRIAMAAASKTTAALTPVLGAYAPVAGIAAGGAAFFAARETEEYILSHAETAVDYAKNLAVSSSIGALLGVAGHYISKAAKDILKKYLKPNSEEVRELVRGIDYYTETGERYTDYFFDDKGEVSFLRYADGKIDSIKNLPEKTKDFILSLTPAGEYSQSQFKTIRRTGEMFFRKTLYSNVENYESIESLVEMARGNELNTSMTYYYNMDRTLHKRKGTFGYIGSEEEFGREVAIAKLSGGNHPESFVNETAIMFIERDRAIIQEAIDLGVFPKIDLNAKFGEKYLTQEEMNMSTKDIFKNIASGDIRSPIRLAYNHRVWNKPVIALRRKEFEEKAQKAFFKQLALENLEEANTETTAQIPLAFENLEEEANKKRLFRSLNKRAETMAKKAVDHILGANSENYYAEELETMLENPSISKERTLLADDRGLTDFLILDPLKNSNMIHKVLNPLIARQKVLTQYGYKDYDDLKKSLDNEYLSKLKRIEESFKVRVKTIDRVKNIDSPIDYNNSREFKQAAKLTHEYENAKKQLDNANALIAGTFNRAEAIDNPKTTLVIDALSKWNYSKLLNSQVLSAMQDIPMVVKDFGLEPVCKTAMAQLNASLGKDRAKFLKNEACKRELRTIGLCFETVAKDRMQRINSQLFTNDAIRQEKLDSIGKGLLTLNKKLNKLSYWTTKLSGITYWTDFWQEVNSKLVTNRLCELLLSSEIDIEGLKDLRFNFKYMDKVVDELSLHMERIDEIYYPNTHLWSDQRAKEVFNSAVLTSTYSNIVIPSVGDVPIALRSQLGRLLVSYKSIAFSMINNVFEKVVNNKVPHIMPYFLLALGFGVLNKYSRSVSKNDPYPLKDPDLWIDSSLSIDALGIIGDGMRTLMDLHKAVKSKVNGREAFKSAIIRFSPNASLAADIVYMTLKGINQIKNPLSDEDEEDVSVSDAIFNMSERDLRSIYSQLPFNNHFILNFFASRAIRRYSEKTGADLMQTRKEKLEERE